MRLLLSGGLVLVLVATAPADEPKPFESKDGKFKAAFPGGKPKESQRDLGKTTQYGFQVEVNSRAFDVTYFDLPAAVEAAKLYELAEKGAVGKDKLLSSREITFGKDKLPAREVLILKNDILVRMVMVLAGERLYLLTAGGPDDFTTGKQAFAFFESFALTK
jgi:hypothetical protein